jgi:exoribonuclease R
MTSDLRRAASLLLAVLCAASSASAAVVEAVPTIAAPAGGVAAPAVGASLSGSPTLVAPASLSAPNRLAAGAAEAFLAAPVASPAAAFASPIAVTAQTPAAVPAFADAAPTPDAVAAAAADPSAPRAVPAAPVLRALTAPAADAPRSGVDARLFDGGGTRAASAAAEPVVPVFDVLKSARPALKPAETRRVAEIDAALTAAVREAVAAVVGRQTKTTTLSRGSTSRRTYTSANPDYDLSVVLPASWSAGDFARFIGDRSEDFKAELEKSASAAAAKLFPGEDANVVVNGPVELTDAATNGPSEGIALFHLRFTGLGRGRNVKADVTLTNSPVYANPYPAYFDDQLRQVEARDGAAAAEDVLADIRVAKQFFKNAVGAYKFYEGGPTAVGIEQMVMQSGRVSDADQGRTVLETGSFDKMIRRLDAAAYDESGRLRTFEEFQAAWTVHNPFLAPANFLSLTRRSYRRIAAAARNYEEAKLAGRPVSLRDLSYRREESSGRAATTRKIVVRLALKGARKSATKLFARVKVMTAREISVAVERQGKTQATLTFDVPARFDLDARAKRILDLFKGWEAVARVEAIEYPGSPPSRDDAKDSAAPDPVPAPAPTRVRPPAAPEPSAPGALTLGLLDRFATQGPRPLERGDEYLYAQGAKTLPPGFEAAWAAHVSRPLPTGRSIEHARLLLLRAPGRTYVMMPAITGAGEETMRPMEVDPSLAQGVVSDTLVEIAYTGNRVLGVRAVGAYPQDMMVGRVVRRGNQLMLDGLFRDNGTPSSLYAPLAMKDGISPREGSILQAFVRPTDSGYEAVPMLDLGGTITPEIAAREIALRRGARGYFADAVVRQAEAEARAEDSAGDYARIKTELERAGGNERVEDLRELPFVTIDPPGAGDLDDAYHIVKEADGTYTWLLATADVAHYVRPGTAAFRAAARVGNTFYSIDKDGIGEYPMNHPVVSKHLASLLDGKDSLAMITRMRFDKDGKFLLDKSEVFLGLIHVKGRYTYNEVADLWKGGAARGITHPEQVTLARELAHKLTALDGKRGKLDLSIDQVESVKQDGAWTQRVAVKDPLLNESHHLIEELKVYGNRVIATRLTGITTAAGVPHISRVHPEQNEGVTRRLLQNLKEIGVPWSEGTLAEFLESVQSRGDLSVEQKQVAQWLVLTSRQSAKYSASDAEGHEGLALEAGAYDHPSAPIRRFSDMYNRTLLEASLEGADPKAAFDAMLKDLKALGFLSLEDYLKHLNGREQAARKMDYEVDAFMSLVELGKPENVGRTFSGYVRMARGGRFPSAVIQLEGTAATVVLNGDQAAKLKLMQRVNVTVRGVDLGARRLDAVVAPAAVSYSASAAANAAAHPQTTMAAAFEAARGRDPRPNTAPRPRAGPSTAVGSKGTVFVINDEGVAISGRAARYYQEVRRMVELYKGVFDLSESLDVMDDAYSDVLAKVSAVEAIAKGRGLSKENTHLEETLVWVDGVLNDRGRKVAVHTHRVFFHRAKNPQSEIREGIRRVDGYIADAEKMFARGGKAEAAMGKLDEVELVFDARGYSEIKKHLLRRGQEVAARSGGRIRFQFLDDLAPMPKDVAKIRAELNVLAKKYSGDGLSKIVEGVIYSRYVGLLLEIKTLEHYHKLGYKILQSGRELFDENGQYVSELDAVVRAPDGKVVLVEAKSARVGLPNEEVLRDKVVYKLETYRKYKAKLDAMIGTPFDSVVFAMDIAIDPDADRSAGVKLGDERKLELAEFLRSKEAELSAEYGFPVSFLFLQSGPGDGAKSGGR